MTKTKQLTECALLIAIAFVLSFIKISELPNGGSTTICSMLPIILISHRNGTKWGVLSAFVFSILQLMQGISNGMPNGAFAFIMCILLDYFLAFSVLGFAKSFSTIIKNKHIGFVLSIVLALALRLVCHTLSGMIIWESNLAASLAYNSSYMIPEIILTSIVGAIIYKQVVKN